MIVRSSKAQVAIFFILALMLSMPCLRSSAAQSPYALIGDDQQVLGPVNWDQNVTKAEIFANIAAAWGETPAFSGAILAAMGGEIVYQEGFGLADAIAGLPIRADTPFAAETISRFFTAAALDELIGQGHLTLDDEIIRFLPSLGPGFKGIRVRHLLSNLSGIDQDFFRYTNKGPLDSFAGFDDLLATISKAKIYAAPGARYEYSGPEGASVDFILIGAIIEALSGETFESFVAKRVFEPYELKNTGFLTTAETVEGLAHPYHAIYGELKAFPATNYSYLLSSGAVYTTVGDLYRFLSSATRNLISATDETALGLATGVMDLAIAPGQISRDVDSFPEANRHRYADTNGWGRGYTQLYSHYLDEGHMLIVLSNVHRATEIYDIRRRFARLTHDLPVALPKLGAADQLWRAARNSGAGEAIRLLGKLKAEPGWADIPFPDQFMHHSRLLRAEQRFAEAIAVTELYIASQPDFFLPYREMGEVYRLMGRPKVAAEYFRKSLARNPDHAAWKADMEAFLARTNE